MKTLLTILAVSLLASTAFGQLVITGVIDGPLPGGHPKAVELCAVMDIADLGQYGMGSANNGGGTDGIEWVFPAGSSAVMGDFIYVAAADDANGFATFFGFEPTFVVDGYAMSINGDDAVELFLNDVCVDVFGDRDTDGTGEPWEHLDGWAYRVDNTPDSPDFDVAAWYFSGPNALDNETDNATAATPFPTGTWTFEPGVANEAQSLSAVKALFN